jgi:ABC-type transport system substrate-binding protein
MRRKLWLSIVMAAVGAGLLLAAGFASPASSGTARTSAGTFTFSKSIGITYVDPALAYFGDEWQFQFATCA